MAIYSLNHKPIGKTTQERPYTTGAHVDYITRPDALSHLAGRGLPVEKEGAKAYFRQAEDDGRKNGRVADKLMLALPRELTPAQQVDLVRGFAEDVSQGKAPWLAAFHGQGEEARNPHCHLVLRDLDPTTGRRVFGTSEKDSTKRLRLLWEQHANQALQAAGRPERIDRRTLEAQGSSRPAQIHEGPRSRAAQRRGHRPRSKPVNARNGRGARHPRRRVDYPSIDGGRTRTEHNQSLREAASSPRDYWDELDRQNLADEMDTLRAIHHPPASVELAFVEAPGRQDRRQHLMAGGEPGFSVRLEGRGLLETQPALQAPEDAASPAVNRKKRHASHYDLVEGVVAGSGVDNSIDFSPALSPSSIPLLPPGQLRSVIPSPVPFEPSPNGIVPRTTDEISAHTLRKHNEKHGNTVHAEILNPSYTCFQGKKMDDNEVIGRVKRRNLLYDKAKADDARGRYDNLMDRSYLNPRRAEKRMDRYRGKRGNQALYDRLGTVAPDTKFGRRPGSLLSTEGLRPGARGKRREADIARQYLPDAVRNHHDAQEQLKGSERANKDHQPTPPATSGKLSQPNTSKNVPSRSPRTPEATQRLPSQSPTPQASPFQTAPNGQRASPDGAKHHPSGPGLDGKPYAPPKEPTSPKLGEVVPRPGDKPGPDHSAAPPQPDAARSQPASLAPQKEPEPPDNTPRRPDSPSFTDRLNARPAAANPPAPAGPSFTDRLNARPAPLPPPPAAEKPPSFTDRLNARPAAAKPPAPAGPSFTDRMNARPVPSPALITAPAPKAPVPAPTPGQAPERAPSRRGRGFDRER